MIGAQPVLRDEMRKLIGKPNWNTGGNNTIPGGLDNGKEIVDAYYEKETGKKYNCKAYTDFRELFEKEKDLDGVQIMTPDHLHGIITTAALKRNIAVSVHKPLSNRLHEGKKVIDLANKIRCDDTFSAMGFKWSRYAKNYGMD